MFQRNGVTLHHPQKEYYQKNEETQYRITPLLPMPRRTRRRAALSRQLPRHGPAQQPLARGSPRQHRQGAQRAQGGIYKLSA